MKARANSVTIVARRPLKSQDEKADRYDRQDVVMPSRDVALAHPQTNHKRLVGRDLVQENPVAGWFPQRQ